MKVFSTHILVVLLPCCFTLVTAKRISTKDLMEFYKTYDTNQPPRLDGPTDVKIGVHMNNLLFDYDKGMMHMSIYQRMSWHDERLKEIFKDSDQKRVYLDDQMVKMTWRPDLFVRNADKTENVDALMKEHMCRVNRTGHVWYVVKMISDLYCPELLTGRSVHTCSMLFESFSHTKDTLTLSWLDSAFDVGRRLSLPGRNLENIFLEDCSENYTTGSYPCLEVKLLLSRENLGLTFDRGVYLVSSILVIISWLGFWIPPSDKRIFLGLAIMFILTMLYMVVAEWREFSDVHRTRATQMWLIFCLCMVLGMVLEFALVYVVCGMMCTRLHGMCGGSELPEDIKPKRSRCGDILDTLFGLVIFPAIFIIAVFAAAFTTFAFR